MKCPWWLDPLQNGFLMLAIVFFCAFFIVLGMSAVARQIMEAFWQEVAEAVAPYLP